MAANTNYRLIVWVKTSSNLDAGWIGARTTAGALLGEIRHGQAGAYTRYIISFNSGSNTSVRLYAGMYGTGTTTWKQIDDVTLQQL